MFTIEDLKKEKDGKSWVVRITNKENHAKLKAIFPKMYEFVNNTFYYLVSTNNAGSSYDKAHYPSTKYNVINFEDIDFMEEKKIIGYKLTKPEYRQAAYGLIPTSTYLSSSKLISKEGNNYMNSNCPTINILKEAGVLDLWFEPVYEPEKPKEEIISMGNFSLKVTKEGIFHNIENITAFVREMGSWFKSTKTFGRYDAVIKNVTFSKTGCQNSETTLLQWKQVWDKYQEFQN